MSIELHCNNCGKLIRAPREAAGKQSKCPACGGRLYIPTPAAELEVLPLAPEDKTSAWQDQALEAERRRVDRLLALEGRDDASGGPSTSERSSTGGSEGPAGADAIVIGYLVAMRDSDLVAAETCLEQLRGRRFDTMAVLNRLFSDQLPPAALSNVPAGVYQGFLRNLRSQL